MYSINIEFKSKKELNKFLRNYAKGKSTMVGPKNAQVGASGEGFLDVVKGVANSKITKGIAKAAAPMVANAIAAQTGSNLAGQVAKGAIGAYAGSGFLDMAKAVGKSKITKGLAKTLAPTVANAIATQTGSNLAGQVAQGALGAYAGSGFLDVVKGVANSKITKGIAKAAAPMVANAIAAQTGSNLAGQVAKGAIGAYAGSGVGVLHDNGAMLPAKVLPSEGNQFLDAKARMAHVRSFRKRGGSALPLGTR